MYRIFVDASNAYRLCLYALSCINSSRQHETSVVSLSFFAFTLIFAFVVDFFFVILACVGCFFLLFSYIFLFSTYTCIEKKNQNFQKNTKRWKRRSGTKIDSDIINNPNMNSKIPSNFIRSLKIWGASFFYIKSPPDFQRTTKLKNIDFR